MTQPAAVPAIRATGLRKTFRATSGETVVAVDDIDLTVRPGEIVAFLGPNGAGKTTTVDMLLGLTAPTGGTVEVYGAGPRARPSPPGGSRAVMQTGGLLHGLHRPRDRRRRSPPLHGRRDRVDDVVERTGLAPIADRRVQACSGGEQQRLQVRARARPRPRPDHPRRAHDRDGRRGAAGVLGHHARRRRGRSHDRLRHPLPRGGRRVRRAHRADGPRSHRARTARPPTYARPSAGGPITVHPGRDVVSGRRGRRGLAGPRAPWPWPRSASPTSRSPAPASRPPSSP